MFALTTIVANHARQTWSWTPLDSYARRAVFTGTLTQNPL